DSLASCSSVCNGINLGIRQNEIFIGHSPNQKLVASNLKETVNGANGTNGVNGRFYIEDFSQ
ncbi:17251_t:CDS:1, partial [Gigaspora rosea]